MKRKMTLGKAIANLEAGRKDAGMIPPEEYIATVDLAILVLKYIDRRAIIESLINGERAKK